MGSYDWIRALATQQRLAAGNDNDIPEPDLSAYSDLLQAPEPESPSLLEGLPGQAIRIGAPLVGGMLGTVLAPGPGTAAGVLSGAGIGAALGGALGEYGAEKYEGRPVEPGEIALSAGLSALPAGPIARAIKPGMGILARGGLHAAEGASQGILAAAAEAAYREKRLPTVSEVGSQALFGSVLGGTLGLGMEKVFGHMEPKPTDPTKQAKAAEVKELPLEPADNQPGAEAKPQSPPQDRVFVAPEKGPAEELPIVHPDETTIRASFQPRYDELKARNAPLADFDALDAEVNTALQSQPPLGRRGPEQVMSQRQQGKLTDDVIDWAEERGGLDKSNEAGGVVTGWIKRPPVQDKMVEYLRDRARYEELGAKSNPTPEESIEHADLGDGLFDSDYYWTTKAEDAAYEAESEARRKALGGGLPPEAINVPRGQMNQASQGQIGPDGGGATVHLSNVNHAQVEFEPAKNGYVLYYRVGENDPLETAGPFHSMDNAVGWANKINKAAAANAKQGPSPKPVIINKTVAYVGGNVPGEPDGFYGYFTENGTHKAAGPFLSESEAFEYISRYEKGELGPEELKPQEYQSKLPPYDAESVSPGVEDLDWGHPRYDQYYDDLQKNGPQVREEKPGKWVVHYIESGEVSTAGYFKDQASAQEYANAHGHESGLPSEANMPSHSRPIGGKIVTGGLHPYYYEHDPNLASEVRRNLRGATKEYEDGPFTVVRSGHKTGYESLDSRPFYVIAEKKPVSLYDAFPDKYGPKFHDIPANFWSIDEAKAYIEKLKSERTPEHLAKLKAIKDRAAASVARQLPAAPGAATPVQERLTSNPNFRDWFHGSKVTDAKGGPAVVYHVTMARDVKESPVANPKTGEYEQKVTPIDFDWFSSDTADSWGVHFGNTPDQGMSIVERRAYQPGGKQAARTIPAALAIRRPLVLNRDLGFTSATETAHSLRQMGIITEAEYGRVSDARSDAYKAMSNGPDDPAYFSKKAIRHGERDANIAAFDELTRIIESKGYDGVRYPNEFEGNAKSKQNYAWIVFHPEQIKSTIGNVGTYSPHDVRIQHQEPQRPPYKSPNFAQPAGRYSIERDGRKYWVVGPEGRRGWFGNPEKAKLRAEQLERHAAAADERAGREYVSREDEEVAQHFRDSEGAVNAIKKQYEKITKSLTGGLKRLLSTKGETDTKGTKWVAHSASFDIRTQKWTSVVGKKINPDNPEADVAVAAMLNRAPFEVFQTVAVKDGKVVGHWAWTSGMPGSMSASHPLITERLNLLAEQFKKGEIDGFYDIHNHPGGDPVPSQADLGVQDARQKSLPGHLGAIITDHTQYSFTPPKTITRLDRKGQTHSFTYANILAGGSIEEIEKGRAVPMPAKGVRDATVNNFSAKQMEVIGPDRVHGLADSHILLKQKVSRITNEARGNYDLSPHMINQVAAMARGSVQPGTVTIIYSSNHGQVRGIQAVPLETFKNTEWMSEWLRRSANEVGGGDIIAHRDAQHGSADDHLEYQAAVDRLVKNGSILDAIVGGTQGTKARAEKGMKFGVDYRGITMPTESVELAAGSQRKIEEARAEAEGVAKTVKPIKLPHQPVAGTVEAHDMGGPGIKGRPEGKGTPEEPNIGPNLPHMAEWPDDLKGRTAEVFKLNDSELDRAVRMRMTPAGLNRAAMKLFDAQSMEEVADKIRKAGYPADMKHMRALALIHSEFELDAAKARDAWLTGGKTAELKEKYDQAIIKSTAYGMELVNKKTEAARILKSLDIAMKGRMDPELKMMGRFIKALRDQGVSSKDIAALRQIYADNPEKFPDALRAALKPSWKDKLLEFWKAGLVGGLATKIANIGSNMGFRGMRDAENMLAAGIDWARVKAMGGQRERYFGEAAAAYHGYASEIGAALGDWMASHEEILKLKPLSTKGLGVGKIGEAGSALDVDAARARGVISGKWGEFVRYGFKSLEADDAFFKHLSASQEIWRRLYRQARQSGLDHKAALQRTVVGAKEVADALHSGKIPDRLRSMLTEVEAMARKDTFQSPLEGIFHTIYKANVDHKWLQIITPFVRTPANIMLETLRRTPLGLLPGTKLYKALRTGIKSGKIGGDVAEDLSKVLMSTTIGAGLSILAYEGKISGGGPVTPRERELKEETGWQPYAVKVGNNWVSYKRIEPLSSVLGMAADIAEGVKLGSTESPGKQAKRITGSILENLTNKTFLAGLEGLFVAMSDPIRYAETFIKQMEASAVPNIVGSAARAVDPTVRKTDVGISPIQARIPFWSKSLPARRTPTGQERTRPGTAIERFASPLTRTTRTPGPAADVADEMERVQYIPANPRDYVAPGGKRVPLTTKEHEALEQARQEATKAMYQTINDASYKNLPDNPDDPKWRYGMKTKKDLLERVYERYLNRARSKIKPDVLKRMRDTYGTTAG